MLDGSGNTDSEVQLRRNHFTGLSDLGIIWRILGIHCRTGSTNRGTQRIRQRSQHFIEFFSTAQCTATGNNHFCLSQFRAVRLGKLTVYKTAQVLSRRCLNIDHFRITALSGSIKCCCTESQHQFFRIGLNSFKCITGINRTDKCRVIHNFG
ncbi:Uncharacterised protein [Mycobacteroides abscessus subsp. massiliense]|nr:Uncharacterised protein [Mycobacteroides abscessus subsp. massiliense]